MWCRRVEGLLLADVVARGLEILLTLLKHLTDGRREEIGLGCKFEITISSPQHLEAPVLLPYGTTALGAVASVGQHHWRLHH